MNEDYGRGTFKKILISAITFVLWFIVFHFLFILKVIGRMAYLILTAIPIILTAIIFAVIRSGRRRF